MTEMKDFDVVLVARSDGADTGPGYWPVTAPAANSKKTPKDAAPEKTPRLKPQMIRLAEEDPRFVEWKVKLGILLKQEVCPNPDEGNPWLVNFPRGYWLYEKSKHLWVSGYPIKGKLFKSPQEFALHLIWLLTASKDYRDCCCVHCNLNVLTKGGPVATDSPATSLDVPRGDRIPHKVTPVPLPNIPGQPLLKQHPPVSIPSPIAPKPATLPPKSPSAVPQAQVPIQQPPQIQGQPHLQPKPQLQLQPQQQQQQQQPLQMQPQHQPQHQLQHQSQHQLQLQPQPQPQPQPQQQPQSQAQSQPGIVWVLHSPILFRTGELVWYQNGSTWRLGMIISSRDNAFELMPIGNGIMPQPKVTKSAPDMRPFYAFTVPPITRPDLKDKIFDQVPWEAMLRSLPAEGNQREMVLLDASKMAASKIDYSYSLWSKISEDPNSKTVSYYGCFFGSERIEIGDSVRLKSNEINLQTADRLVMGLRYIFTARDAPGAVFFRGHIFQSVTGDANHPNIVRDEHLPVALREEKEWRNSVSPNQRWRWALVKENIVLKEASIKGRFYPTHRLMPIMNRLAFQTAIANGQAEELSAHLNNRLDGAGRHIGRKRNRLDALGAAVPHTTKFEFEPYVREEAFDEVSFGE